MKIRTSTVSLFALAAMLAIAPWASAEDAADVPVPPADGVEAPTVCTEAASPMARPGASVPDAIALACPSPSCDDLHEQPCTAEGGTTTCYISRRNGCLSPSCTCTQIGGQLMWICP